MERTFLMIKPDGVQRRIVGKIISRLEAKGLKIVALKFMKIDRELANRHYAEHANKPFFNDLVAFITSGPVVVMVVEGENAIRLVRTMMGKTAPVDSEPGTIRGDFGISTIHNIVHGSDGPESAKREIELFFSSEELVDYTLADSAWL